MLPISTDGNDRATASHNIVMPWFLNALKTTDIAERNAGKNGIEIL